MLSVAEGDNVEKGQNLVRIDLGQPIYGSSNSISSMVRSLESRIDEKKTLLNILVDEVDKNIVYFERKRKNVFRVIDNLSSRKQLVLNKKNLLSSQISRFESLQGMGYSSDIEIEDKKIERISLMIQELELSNEVEDANLRVKEIDRQEIQESYKTSEQISILNQEIYSLEYDRSNLLSSKDYYIESPFSGYIDNLSISKGDVVGRNEESIMTVVPENFNFLIYAYVSSESIGRIEKGLDVNIRYDSFPYREYGVYKGKVIEVSSTHTGISPEIVSEDGSKERMYRVRIEIDSDTDIRKQFKSGMSFSSDIIIRDVSLINWLANKLAGSK